MPPVRKIVLLRPHEWLQASSIQRDFAVCASMLEDRVQTRGMNFDSTAAPAWVPDFGTSGVGRIDALRHDYGPAPQMGYVLSAEFDDEEAVARFEADRKEEVRGIFTDPEIAPFPAVAQPATAVGTAADVVQALNLAPLTAAQADGRGVKIMVVDTGVDQSRVPVSGGWSPRPGVPPGNAAPDHGTMVAFDAKLAAPSAMVFDYPLMQSAAGGQWTAFLSDAIRLFGEILIQVLQVPGPAVVVNSWGMYDRASDAAPDNPQNYASNPRHPFNQLMCSMIGSGIDVVFAAGNCGGAWPDRRCGSSDRGPGRSILGANSHPDVITVGAVTIHDDVLGYSSEGPGTLSANKPDLAGFSHFQGSGISPFDGGTSAACPVVAGVVAALRSKPSARGLTPAQLKAFLLKSARDVAGNGWDPQTGYGVIDAGAAWALLP